jgi:NADP-dependent 3-hydroxy acid dehydrogenase YdfG
MKYKLRDLQNQVYVVTGATSGIGRAIAIEMVAAGAKVILNARREEDLISLREELGLENCTFVAGDSSDPTICRAIADAAIENFGKIDGVIPNAGIGFFGSILDYSDLDINRMIRTNLEGTVHLIRACLPIMISQGRGDIVIISSVAGFRGGGNEAVYSATKHAQVGLAGSLDRELRVKGIRVSLICPATTETKFALGSGREPDSFNISEFLKPDDVAYQVMIVLGQPLTVRTLIWTLWPMGQRS